MDTQAFERGLGKVALLGKVIRVLLMIMLPAYAVLALASALNTYAAIRQDFGFMADMELLFLAIGACTLVSMVTGLLSWVFFLVWVYQAHANLRRAGFDDTTYSAGWAVGSYFVPIANLFVPFRAMRELWNRSHGENAYQAESAVGEVSSWWTCSTTALGISLYLVLVAIINITTPYKILSSSGANGVLSSFATVLGLGSIWFQFVIVGRISKAQQSMVNAASVFE